MKQDHEIHWASSLAETVSAFFTPTLD